MGQWDITPNVNLLRSLRAERFVHGALIGEAVDNSFDAGASEVTISVSSDLISFRDNGAGISADRLKSLFSLGDHGAMTTTKLGRYGVGIKNQAINAGDILEVSTVCAQGKYLARVNWRKVLSGGSWMMDEPVHLPVAVGSPTGTTIKITALQKSDAFNQEKISAQLAQTFHPALKASKKIVLNGLSIKCIGDPDLSDIIERTLLLSDGRSAHVRAGILRSPSSLMRVHVDFEHRTIMAGSSLGCGEYSGLNKMYARVSLRGPWTPSKYKDDLPKRIEREELDDALEDALRPILEKCSTATISVKLSNLLGLINDSIPEELRAARPKHLGGETGPGPKRKRASGLVEEEKSEDSDSPARTRARPRNRLIVTFDGVGTDSVGTCETSGKIYRVDLCKDEPFISRLIEHRDEEVAVMALTVTAMALFEYKRNEFEFEEFGKRLSRHLSAQDFKAMRKAAYQV